MPLVPRLRSDVHSLSRVTIPEVVAEYPAASADAWRAAQEPWAESEFTDYAVWGPYAGLAKDDRFWLPGKSGNAGYKFVEFHAAMLLGREGYECWGGVQLFDYEVLLDRKGKGPAKKNTELVRSKARSWDWPSTIQRELSFTPKNPDVVAYLKTSREWAFVEVKKNDPCHDDQLKGLAVLHLLTGAPVGVVRMVVEGKPRKSKTHDVVLTFEKDAILEWVHPRFRQHER